jgi:SAM-dependent methyltransferase
MISDDQVAQHYARPQLLAAIEAALAKTGKLPPDVTIEDLAPVDEFHTGGRLATKELLSQLQLSPGALVLDVGCGLGGAARFCAQEFDAQVTGIDLTHDYIETARALTGWVGLESKVTFRQASATDLPFKKRSFDVAYLIHVAMNIADKTGLFAGVSKVLRPGGVLGLYEIMRLSSDNLSFPLPWAPHPSLSFVSTPDSYEASLTAAGFEITARRDQTVLALAGAEELLSRLTSPEGPPPLGLHLLMGDYATVKLANMIEGFTAGLIVPYEIIARRG